MNGDAKNVEVVMREGMRGWMKIVLSCVYNPGGRGRWSVSPNDTTTTTRMGAEPKRNEKGERTRGRVELPTSFLSTIELNSRDNSRWLQ